MKTLALLIFLSLCQTVCADSFDDAVTAYERGDHETALDLYRVLAEQGNASAQVNLGLMYANGEGVPRDDREAVKWYRMAAEQGDVQAQVNLGVKWANGEGVPRNNRQAVKWYRMAAEQGNAQAQLNLGVKYANGEGVPRDDREAVGWFQMAAEQGHASAQFSLGLMYANGEGVPQDDREAVKWFRMAAAQGDAGAQFNLGVKYSNGEGVLRDDREAVKWYEMAAEQGNALAQLNLGVKYANGEGVRQDYSQAYYWWSLSASQGEDKAREYRSVIARRMTPDQVATAQRLSGESAQATTDSMLQEAAVEDYPSEPNRNIVRQIQANLAALGYAPGPDDGITGGKTIAAIKRYQRDNGMTADGLISESLLNSTEISLDLAALEGAPARNKSVSSGSGFTVGIGYVITNLHLVKDCQEIRLYQADVSVTGGLFNVDEFNDLAVVKTSRPNSIQGTFRTSGRIALEEDVVVVGYQPKSLLSDGPNVTKGTVSALSGIGDDPRFLQISAPVQPGNEGGPLLDRDGNVIGMVVSKPDVIKAAKLTADAPQNAILAIKAPLLKSFLDIHDIPYETKSSQGENQNEKSTEDIAEAARGFTVAIECFQ